MTQLKVEQDLKESIDSVSLPLLGTVTVTYNPSIEELSAQLHALPLSSIKVIVDNASPEPVWLAISSLLFQIENIHLLRNEVNLGVAAALNKGVNFLENLPKQPDLLLLLDQDSKPQPGSVQVLISAFQSLVKSGHKVGAVGPSLQDPSTELTHGFHQHTRFRWLRVYPPTCSITPVTCANLNGSGTLIPIALFQQLGGLDEKLFIDHVDTEWSFRVTAHGYGLWGIPNAIFTHSMGEASQRIWLLGWRLWPIRSPLRHFYLFRNATILMKRAYVPRVWKTWAIAKLLVTAVIMTITGPHRWRQISSMWQGICIGLGKNEK